ncbi:MAG: TIGR03619 family F420-dependent LLM class oxidoreductase [Actinomycetota bacterium]|nr:TIGR03619 family F420-dependent LLM class oxidoreductase [Actinomycetota bacterium]
MSDVSDVSDVSGRMRLGFVLPQVGDMAGPEALVEVAQRAEALGFVSLWVADRLLWPLDPRAPYPASADGVLPAQFQSVLDPLVALTFVAAHTSQVRLGTSVLNIPYYNPVLLARQLTTLDVVSAGRLDVGLGLGWSPDEFEAAGAAMAGRGERADEFIEVLKAIWTTDPVEFDGTHFQVARSIIGPKPIQKPHPPLYLAAYAPAAMRRTARVGDGWNPAGIPLAAMAAMHAGIQAMAREEGRDGVALVVRANCHLTDSPCARDRPMFVGSVDQVTGDVKAVEAIGAAEVLFDVQFSPGVRTTADVVDRMERLWAATR